MSIVEPPAPRSRVEQTPQGLSIVISSSRSRAQAFVLVVWLGGWLAGEVFAFRQLGKNVAEALAQGSLRGVEGGVGGTAFLAFWLVAWTAAGLFVMGACLYMLAGREVIEVNAEGLTRYWRPLSLPRSRRYLAAHISNLRSVTPPPRSAQDSWDPRWWTDTWSSVAFDYGATTVHLASGVDEPEGKQILAAILNRFPALGKGKEGEAVPVETKW